MKTPIFTTFCLVCRSVAGTRGRPPIYVVVQLAFRTIVTVSFQRILADMQVCAPVMVPTASAVVILAGLFFHKLKEKRYFHRWIAEDSSVLPNRSKLS